jgi:hypothetical protein
MAVGFWSGGEGDGAVCGARSPSSLEDVDWNDERERERERERDAETTREKKKGETKKKKKILDLWTVQLHM